MTHEVFSFSFSLLFFINYLKVTNGTVSCVCACACIYRPPLTVCSFINNKEEEEEKKTGCHSKGHMDILTHKIKRSKNETTVFAPFVLVMYTAPAFPPFPNSPPFDP